MTDPSQTHSLPGEKTSTPHENYISGIVNWRLTVCTHAWKPNTDVYDNGNSMIVRIEVAGMQETGFSIQADQKTITIRGLREDIAENRAFYQMEIPFGEFFIEIEIPVPILIKDIQANYHNGFLYVTLPKVHPHQISIHNG